MKPTCCGEVVENIANGKTFYFCKSCKKEPEDNNKYNPLEVRDMDGSLSVLPDDDNWHFNGGFLSFKINPANPKVTYTLVTSEGLVKYSCSHCQKDDHHVGEHNADHKEVFGKASL